MCGICGFMDWSADAPRDKASLEARAEAMAGRLAHRGPDDAGAWADPGGGLALGHRRLAVIDLSPRGAQPMRSHSGRWVISYNGEVYNFPVLRRELEGLGHAFRGGSDTEVLLAAVEQWGVRRAVERCVGMFAFALWDARERELWLARDRLGEKPLYWGLAGDTLLFGSEFKALRAHPAWRGGVDRGALTLYLRHAYVPEPFCIYEGFRKLQPASLLRVRRAGGPGQTLAPEPYWSLAEVVERGRARPFAGDLDEAVDELEGLLRNATAGQLAADVPVGCFLSGGVDSATVAAMAQQAAAAPLKTFTVGYTDGTYDETAKARAVADRLGTEHTELMVEPADALGVVDSLAAMYDEPFADSSQIPTHLIARLTRSRVTVSMTGDGGDEVFGGYNRYLFGPRLWARLGRLPRPARLPLARALAAVPHGAVKGASGGLNALLPPGRRMTVPQEKVVKVAAALNAADGPDFYRRLCSIWQRPEGLVVGGAAPRTVFEDPESWPEGLTLFEHMRYLDMRTYLLGDILAKVDRAAMAASLESRAPFLDHRVVEFAWRLPEAMLLGQGGGKLVLRRLLARHVPEAAGPAPKQGFAVPVRDWLAGPLRGWVEDLLQPETLRAQGYLRPEAVRRVWRGYLAGRREDYQAVWALAQFQAWLNSQT